MQQAIRRLVNEFITSDAHCICSCHVLCSIDSGLWFSLVYFYSSSFSMNVL